jgi:hypothetical protein
VQHVSMLEQPCPTQSERPQSAVHAVSSHRSWLKVACAFEMRSAWRSPATSWPVSATSVADTVTMRRDHFVWPLVDAPAYTLDQLSVILHSSRIESTQPGGVTWL